MVLLNVVRILCGAAIDQNCEKYIVENNLQVEVEEKNQRNLQKKGVERPRYQGSLEGNLV